MTEQTQAAPEIRALWKAFKQTDEYTNSRQWAQTIAVTHTHLDGAMWAFWAAGYEAGVKASDEAAAQAAKGPE